MITATKQTPADFCTSTEPSFDPPPGSRCLEVVERLRLTLGSVHPGWIKATSILLKGMERLRLQELAEAAQADNEALPLSPDHISFLQ